MKRPELYQRTVDILVAAYFNDTLEHGNCYACAVGNIIAGNRGLCFLDKKMDDRYLGNIWTGQGFLYWHTDNDFNVNPVKLLGRDEDYDKDKEYPDMIENERQQELIDCTGYNIYELHIIERAFEKADYGKNKEEHMFNGLMAVIDTLDQIHENTDSQTTTETKSKFKRQLQCQ